MSPRLTRIGGRIGVWLYRRSNGRLVGAGKVLMHTVLVRAPEVIRYARKAGRTIPVAVLEPV